MAPSPQNSGRPRLGTVLSRKNWEDRRSNSTTSSVMSHDPPKDHTGSSFDPQNEALASTQPLTYSPSMKDVRKSPEHERYEIDVKAPQATFSEGSETDSDGADISIEIGRGGKHAQRIEADSRNDGSIHSSNVMIREYRSMYSSPLSNHLHTSKANKDNARILSQDAQTRLASMSSQKENRDPASQPFKSLTSSELCTKMRRTIAEIRERVSEDHGGLLLNEDRPLQAVPVTKATRFSRSNRNHTDQLSATRLITATGMADVNQSYILPDLPNLSQLISGTIGERSPGGVHLADHPALSQTPHGARHMSINAVPIPADEKAIFVSLNLLQGKVKELETAATGSRKTIEELKMKSLVLKAENRDLKADNDRLRDENIELLMLHMEYRRARQHVHKHREQNLDDLRKRRHENAAVQVNTEVSKILKECQEEDLFSLTPTASVKMRSMSAPLEGKDDLQKSSAKLSSGPQQKADGGNLRQSKKVVIEENASKTGKQDACKTTRDRELSEDITYLTTLSSNAMLDLRRTIEAERIDAKHRKNGKRHYEDIGTATQRASEATGTPNFLLDLRRTIEAERIDAKHRKNGKSHSEVIATATQRASEATGAPSTAQPALPRKPSIKDASQQIQPEVTAASRGQAQVNLSCPADNQDISEDITDQVSRPLSHTASRNNDPTATATAAATSNISRPRRRTFDLEDENMTSGFILPDITIDQATAADIPVAATILPAADAEARSSHPAHHDIHSIKPHDSANCIVCSRLTASTSANHMSVEKKTVIVPKPVPVSDTPVSPTPDNPDPTLRPAQKPGVALAVVLKELNDQHEHLKARLATAQASYQQTDPRLSRASRARLTKKMEKLQRQCDGVADMIYRLYDVLEGQRGNGGEPAGLEMTEEEVEVTVMGLREVMMGRRRMARARQHDPASGSENGEAEIEAGEETG